MTPNVCAAAAAGRTLLRERRGRQHFCGV